MASQSVVIWISGYLFVAIDRATTRHVYVELHDNKRMEAAVGFQRQTLTQSPFKVEKILTDNGIEFGYNLLVEAKKLENGVHYLPSISVEFSSQKNFMCINMIVTTAGKFERSFVIKLAKFRRRFPAMESWNHSFKVEAVHDERFLTQADAKYQVFE